MNDQQEKCYRLAMSACHAGRYEQAIEILRPLSETSGTMALLARYYLGQSHYRLALRLARAGQYYESTPHFQAAARYHPAGGGMEMFLATCRNSRQKTGTNEDGPDIQKPLPERPAILIRLAWSQWKQGVPHEALMTLRQAIREDPQQAELHYQLAVLLIDQQRWPDARKALEQALFLDPAHVAAHERMAQLDGLSGDIQRAMEHLQTAHQQAPDRPRIALQLTLLARALRQSGQAVHIEWREPAKRGLCSNQRTIDQLGELLIQEPDFVETFLALPVSEMDQEVFFTLAAILKRALARHPEYADLHFHCGAVHQRLGHNHEAIQHAEQAVRINPRYLNALILLARLYTQTEQINHGILRLEEAIRLGADYPDAHYLIGRLYQQRGLRQQAVRSYQRALALKQDYLAAREALSDLQAVTV